jgi:hypothetical protein
VEVGRQLHPETPFNLSAVSRKAPRMANWTLLTALPALTTPEQYSEHQQSTPASFDLPPVLRCKVANVAYTLKPAIEGLQGTEQGLQADLYVTEASARLSILRNCIIFHSSAILLFDDATSRGLSVPYVNITLHAISRSSASSSSQSNGDTPAEARPAILCQLDALDQDEDEYDDPSELIIVPPAGSNSELPLPLHTTRSPCAQSRGHLRARLLLRLAAPQLRPGPGRPPRTRGRPRRGRCRPSGSFAPFHRPLRALLSSLPPRVALFPRRLGVGPAVVRPADGRAGRGCRGVGLGYCTRTMGTLVLAFDASNNRLPRCLASNACCACF